MTNQNGILDAPQSGPQTAQEAPRSPDPPGRCPITPYRTGKDALTHQEAIKLLSLMDSVEAEALIRLGINTGMRRSDIVAIEMGNINLETKEVVFWEHKKRRNWVSRIDDVTRASLMKHIAVNVTPIKSKYLFPAKRGDKGHMSDRYAYNVFQRALIRANITTRPFHALRSTFVKLAKLVGWSDVQIAQQIGDSLEVVQRHYATPSDGEMREISSTHSLL